MMLAGLPVPDQAVEDLAELVRVVGADDLADRLDRAIADGVKLIALTLDERASCSRRSKTHPPSSPSCAPSCSPTTNGGAAKGLVLRRVLGSPYGRPTHQGRGEAMAFSQLVNAQEVEVVVEGPGDVTRLYLCQGIAEGSTSVSVQPGQFQAVTDTWQFHVGPTLGAGDFRRAIAIMSFAGLSEQDPSGGWMLYNLESFGADFDDDNSRVKVNVTNVLQVSNPSSTGWASSSITRLSYNVTILAAL